jgi:hypothetical protein
MSLSHAECQAVNQQHAAKTSTRSDKEISKKNKNNTTINSSLSW